MTTWTRVTDPAADTALLPTWFAGRMLAAARGDSGSFGLLLATGDVLRVASLRAAHLSSDGTILLDVMLDLAGVPDGVDTAWRSKHYLGAPAPGATRATVNLAQVVAVVEFTALQQAEPLEEEEGAAAAKAEANLSATVVELRHAVEEATERREPSA
jgi:hypothetical protein